MYQIIQHWNPSEEQPSNILTIGKPLVQETQKSIVQPAHIIKPTPPKQNLTQNKSSQKFWIIPLLLVFTSMFFLLPKNNVKKIEPSKEPLIEKSQANITATPKVSVKPNLEKEKNKQETPKKIVRQEKKINKPKENIELTNESKRNYNNNASEDLISIKGL